MLKTPGPYNKFIEHSNLNSHTELAFLEDVRQAYSNKFITVVSGCEIDLLGYAEAGHASISSASELHQHAKSLSFSPPPSRLSDKPGIVTDSNIFEKLEFTHQNTTFTVYDVEWPSLDGGSERRYIIVADPDSANPKGKPAPLEQLLQKAGQWTVDFHDEIYVFEGGRWRKDSSMWNSVKSASWDDVIIDKDIKDDLVDDIDGFFDSQRLYQEYSVPWKRGIILHGQPGNGKTISIRAVLAMLASRDFPIPGLYVKSFTDNVRGNEWAIDSIFDQARRMSPCALILEDVDSMVTDEVRSYFLNQLDGINSNDGILIIGSTNNLEKLDPALSKRPSRFDRKYLFKLPDNAQRRAYAQYWGKKLQKNPKVDFNDAVTQYIADATDGFSFAYLKELFVVCLLILAGQRGRCQAATEDEKTATVDGDTGESVRLSLPKELTENLLAKLIQRQSTILHGEMAAAALAAEKAQGEDNDAEQARAAESQEASV